MDREEILEILGKLRSYIRRKYKAEIIGIFGSYAKGEQRKESDLDILVRFYTGATLFDLTGLAQFLEEKLNLKVDIVPIDTIRPELKETIENETITL